MRVTLRVKMMSIIIVKMMTGNCIKMMVVIPGNISNDDNKYNDFDKLLWFICS